MNDPVRAKYKTFTSPDGLHTITLCGQRAHVKAKAAPSYTVSIPANVPCDLCLKEGVKFCELCTTTVSVANNLITYCGRAPQFACPIHAENAPLGSLVRPLKRENARSIKQHVHSIDDDTDGVECSD